MELAVFDIGGTSVKYGLWDGEKLQQQGAFKTPTTYEKLKKDMKQILRQSERNVEGIAISAPGAVNVANGTIEGTSAVPYLSGRPIFSELFEYFRLPVHIENDANCAGICEVEKGAGRNASNLLFVIIGTGVGGAIFINRQLYKGSHLFGGEFGYMLNPNEKTLSENGTLVKVAERYSRDHNRTLTGKELFALYDRGDRSVKEYLEDLYEYIAESLYNLQVAFDPELIVLGGGVSVRPELVEGVQHYLRQRLEEKEIAHIMPEICACQYHNEANLIGAALNFTHIVSSQ